MIAVLNDPASTASLIEHGTSHEQFVRHLVTLLS